MLVTEFQGILCALSGFGLNYRVNWADRAGLNGFYVTPYIVIGE